MVKYAEYQKFTIQYNCEMQLMQTVLVWVYELLVLMLMFAETQ